MQRGIFYAVGIGAGDPMDMTLKAKKVLENADVIIIPVKKKGSKSTAYSIASQVADMSRAEKKEVVFSMKSSADYRKNFSRESLNEICKYLRSGKNTAMITLGDVSVYSTAAYIRQELEELGFVTETVSGITSFCAGAARAGIGLCENAENLVIISGIGNPERTEHLIDTAENVIIMKAGTALERFIDMLEKKNLLENTIMLCNVGMDGEYIGIPDIAYQSYFTTLIIRKGGLR